MKLKLQRISVFLLILTINLWCVRVQAATGSAAVESATTSVSASNDPITLSSHKTTPVLSWLIATSDAVVYIGASITLEVVKPPALSQWPSLLNLRILHDDEVYKVKLIAREQKTSGDVSRLRYHGVMPNNLSGLVRVSLTDVESNQLALLVAKPGVSELIRVETTPVTESDEEVNVLAVDEPALSVNESMYFVVGGSTDSSDTRDTTARFQLSFKYRLFDADSLPVEWLPVLSDFYFGYTQSSLWDIGEDSAPFHDTSYRPNFFWQGRTGNKGLLPELLRTGYEHESNGNEGENSRSLNILFVRPFWRTIFSDKRTLIFAPKVYAYLNKEGNTDIQSYRGYADWVFRYGHEDGFILATQLRLGTSGRGSAQFDFTYPIRRALFSRTGGFLHLQLFTGYGETLLDYNIDHGTQIRVGFSFVR